MHVYVIFLWFESPISNKRNDRNFRISEFSTMNSIEPFLVRFFLYHPSHGSLL